MPIQYADRAKQPGEVLLYSMTFTPGKSIATGDTLTGTPTVKVTRLSDGVNVTSDVSGPPVIVGMVVGTPALVANTITAKIKSGTDGEDYKITFVCGTTNGETVEEDLILQVREY